LPPGNTTYPSGPANQRGRPATEPRETLRPIPHALIGHRAENHSSPFQPSDHGMASEPADVDVGRHVIYNPEYGVLICRVCRHAIKPGRGVRQHLMDKHGAIGGAVRKGLIDYAGAGGGGWGALADLEEVAVPEATYAPIEELALLEGYECKDCG
jgi:hypothetical protein